MRLIQTGMLAVAAMVVASYANAAEPRSPATSAKPDFSCLAYTSTVSRSLFNTSGGFATTGPAANSFVDCTHNSSGLYVNIWNSTPLRDFDIGNEVDVRGGWRGSAGWLDLDMSAAWYNFGVGDLGRFNTTDLRLTGSHSFDLGRNVNVKPYLTFDYQHSTTLHADDFAVAGGAVLDWKVFERTSLSVDGAVWYSPLAEFSPGKGPVYSISPKLSFEVTPKLTAGPMALFTSGSKGSPNDHRIKTMVGGFASYKF